MNNNQSAISLHNAHFPLQQCVALADELRRSGHYSHVDISSRVYCNGEYFAKVYVQPKPSAQAVGEQLFSSAY